MGILEISRAKEVIIFGGRRVLRGGVAELENSANNTHVSRNSQHKHD